MLVSPASAESVADVAGHYYLHGVREVGSELLLRPDGRYDWFLSYGASDATSSGIWRLDGTHITLTANVRPKTITLKLEPVSAWHDKAWLGEAGTRRLRRVRAKALALFHIIEPW